MKTLALTALAVLMLAMPAVAETHVQVSGSASQEEREDYIFRLAEDSTLSLTLSCSRNARGQGHLRLYFYERSPQGGWRQMQELRVMIRDNQPEITGEFALPAGEYTVTISARRMDYAVVLEDAHE